ncbi:variant erythrocyte surface antigen-1 family protein [Babesia divergens]|uniref:Variant erythrocyte surface antigen-1 family protein n=1 Tax=Babesia divergens TaxID=32595 RepID=A0AAD9GBZ0_BABDI|nr:variant erythrocyte surface antigen-1 family protein [Babesia divergens]
MARLVCYMYYTDVFVGTFNIVNLNKALIVELKDSVNSIDLTQLVQGLCLFMGYPSCLCSLKANVDKSLQDISGELKEDFKAVQSCVSITTLTLNCSSCDSNDILCKCCVISCIKELPNKSQCSCPRLSNTSKECKCKGTKEKCCKDFLSGLEACLSLLNLKTDLEGCTCNNPKTCCESGTCTKGCKVCSPKKFPDNAMTGLGICPMNPKKLAGKLETFFGTNTVGSCSCTCNGSSPSCCCLACESNMCSASCNSECRSSGCSSQHTPKECPCKTFCSKINSIQVSSGSSLMKCCDSGNQCHCKLGSSKCSGQCCSTKDKQSLKCMIRRLVLYFKELKSDISSPSKDNFKNCCELMCVLKTCEFLDGYLKDTSQKPGKDFNDELSKLRFAGPCGQELWRTLDSFLNFIRYVFYPKANVIRVALEDKSNGHAKKCKCNSGTCTCSPSSCPGCTAVLEKLQTHKDVLSLMTRGYSSAYDSASASWNSLTPSNSGSNLKCCGSSSPPSCKCPQTCSPCNPSQCCPDCPQKKAAKIFLGMLPCLYYGLKILRDRCQDPLTWPDWQYISVSYDKPSSGLAKFLQAWGYDVRPLISKKGFEFPPMLENLYGSDKIFEKLYDFVSKKYFSIHVSDASKSHPTTVRSMLLWLYGLRFQKHFSDLVENCKSLCSPFGNSFNSDAFCYYIHTCSFILPVAVISTIETSDSAQKAFSSSSSPEWTSFYYPSDSSALADMFFDYIRKIFAALNFLCIQCRLAGDQGGWQNCWYGKSCKLDPLSSTSGSSSSSSGCSCLYSKAYLCTGKPYGTPDVHDHCSGSFNGATCRGFDSSGSTGCPGTSGHKSDICKPCPHPLQRFLCHGSDSLSQNYPFGLSDITPMGFESSNLSSTARDGWSLYHVLKAFCEDGFYPLTRLVEFALCISRYPPETLGEFFAFFKMFVSSDVFKSHFESYVSGEPGFYSGQELKNALENLYGSHSGSHSDLKSLYDCSTSTCGKYLYPLTYNASDLFSENFVDTYLSVVCYSAEKFKEKLEKFHHEASTKSLQCCSASCQKIVECPCALPFLYSYGFTFWSPNSLNGGKKSCKNFIAQLGHVVANGNLFTKLLEEIPKFIWSIRLPFFFGFLYVWFFVLSYFFYVILIKLDTFHTGSHLHLPRSFKILPSTLFSDASSKLKDLSYFTL